MFINKGFLVIWSVSTFFWDTLYVASNTERWNMDLALAEIENWSLLYWVAHSGFCIKWSPMAETHCWWVAINLILHFRSGKIFVGCCFLRIKLGTCWLNLSSKPKDVQPTYWQSQRHTYSNTTILWLNERHSIFVDGLKDFLGWEKDWWFNCSETMLNRRFDFVFKFKRNITYPGKFEQKFVLVLR